MRGTLIYTSTSATLFLSTVQPKMCCSFRSPIPRELRGLKRCTQLYGVIVYFMVSVDVGSVGHLLSACPEEPKNKEKLSSLAMIAVAAGPRHLCMASYSERAHGGSIRFYLERRCSSSMMLFFDEADLNKLFVSDVRSVCFSLFHHSSSVFFSEFCCTFSFFYVHSATPFLFITGYC